MGHRMYGIKDRSLVGRNNEALLGNHGFGPREIMGQAALRSMLSSHDWLNQTFVLLNILGVQ